MFGKSIVFVFSSLLCIQLIESDNNVISVAIKDGKINGKQNIIDGKELNIFLGIPYAEPPIGDLRFRKPLPVRKWTESIDATKWPNPCSQMQMPIDLFQNRNFSEDCLYLNIWSPVISDTNDDLKAVMFWIHGGGLFMGSSNEETYNSEILSTKGDVVVVTFNYRLSTFGFLYTGTDEAPGNVGLWDMALALEWVNDNIKYFGGDPNKITIFGESGGSWAVSLLLLSPITRNLYQNAIMMSGSSLNKVAGDEANIVKKKWLKGAKLIGCIDEENNSEDNFTPKMIECLKNCEAESLLKIPNLPQISNGLLGWLSHVVNDGQFLPSKPLDMLEKGDYKKSVNLLFGTTEDEGSYVLKFMVDNVKYNDISPQNLTYNEAFDELKKLVSTLSSNVSINGEDVAKLYFTGLSDSNDYDLLRRTIGIAIGDWFLGCPTIQFAKLLFSNDRDNSNVYQYYFNSKLGEEKLICSKWMGACHGNDIWPVFGIPFRQFDRHLDRERDISQQMIEFFTHFAKAGYPSPQNGVHWPKYYTINDNIIAPYYEITNEPKPVTNFLTGLKIHECDYLWKTYIEQQ